MRAWNLAVRGLFCAAAFLFPITTLSGQAPYVLVDSVRLPAESFVGDPVELRYTIRTEGEASVPDEIPQPRWGEIGSVSIAPTSGGFDLRMTVTPYQPGSLAIPRLSLGGVRLDGLSIIVQTVLSEGENAIRPALRPQRLPGTRAALLLFGFAASFVIALAIYLLGPGRKHLMSLISRFRAGAPFRHLTARVHHLERSIKQYSIRDFYIELSHEIQRFMTSRIDRNCLALTSTELIASLPELEESCGAAPSTTQPLVEVISVSDSVKFERKSVRQQKRVRHLQMVHAVAAELEMYRKRRGRPARRRGRADGERKEQAHVGA